MTVFSKPTNTLNPKFPLCHFFSVTMCIKSSKPSLNPKAKEWQPHVPLQPNQLLPHLIFPAAPSAAVTPPPEQPFSVATLYTAAPPQKLFLTHHDQQPCFFYHDNISLQYSWPSCYNQGFITPCFNGNCTLPPQLIYYPLPPPEKSEKLISGGGDVKINHHEEEKVKSPKRPPADVARKGTRRVVVPPRLQRAKWSFHKKPQLLMTKQEWRSRKVSRGCDVVFPSAEKKSPLKTTVMIKNIPNRLRRDLMLEFLDYYCKEYFLEYDFFYLPMDFRKRDNLGYAFVNFTSAICAMKFKDKLQNYKWNTIHTDKGPITSKKICEITWARIQGKDALIRRFQGSIFACDKFDFLPVVFDPPRNGYDRNPSPPLIVGTLNRQGISRPR